jgi:hypothetical protein
MVRKRKAAITFLMLTALAIYSCSGRYLRTESVSEGEITGVYTLILYGGNSPNDLNTFAILAKEGTPYSFDVFAPDFDYRTIKGVHAKEALEEAEKFVSFHPDFWKIELSKLVCDKGLTIGYEVRPLYNLIVHNGSAVPDVYYKKTDGKVIVYIRSYGYHAPFFPFKGGMTVGPK